MLYAQKWLLYLKDEPGSGARAWELWGSVQTLSGAPDSVAWGPYIVPFVRLVFASLKPEVFFPSLLFL